MTFLLVHGAWCASWAWARLAPELEVLGIAYQAIDLPGHGQNSGSMWSVTLADYADAVIKAAESTNGPVVAAGHSMGGIVISEAASKAPAAFDALTCLNSTYVTGAGQLLSLIHI